LTYNSIEDYFEILTLRKYFTSEELFFQLRKFAPDLNKSTFRWHVYELKRKNKIRNIMRGVYSLTNKPYFEPLISSELKKTAGFFTRKYPSIEYCVWSSQWLNDLTINQPVKYFTIIEAEEDVIEDTFYFLQEKKMEVFIQPGKSAMDKYVLKAKDPVIILPLITRSPILIKGFAHVPSVEKILVDIFSDQETFFLFAGNELKNIFRFALKKYSINFSRLLSYADRRGKKELIKSFILEQADDSLKEVLNG
jgi:hypothetical protein